MTDLPVLNWLENKEVDGDFLYDQMKDDEAERQHNEEQEKKE